jgi:deoxyadenosine/deoxycytidine kinase
MFIALSGNIGAGKSVLAALLREKYGWAPHFEYVDDNPFLTPFYTDMRRWAFHLQVYFLSHRVFTHRACAIERHIAVQDRCIYEDGEVFAPYLHRIGVLDEAEYGAYRTLYQALTATLAPPDLLIHLHEEVPVLRGHIVHRGRPCEQAISDEYLAGLNDEYARWIAAYDRGPVLTLDIGPTDRVQDTQRLEDILHRIEQAVRRHGG